MNLAPLTVALMNMKPSPTARGQGILSGDSITKNRRDSALSDMIAEFPTSKAPGILDAFSNPNDITNRGLVGMGVGLMSGKGIWDSLAQGISGWQQGVDQGQQNAIQNWQLENQARQQRLENARADKRLSIDEAANARSEKLLPLEMAAKEAGLLEQTPDGGYFNKQTREYIPPDPRIQEAYLKQLEAEGRIKVQIAGASAAASAANTPTHYQSTNLALPDGSIVSGRFNPLSGTYEVQGQDGKYGTAPVGTRAVTDGAGGVVTANQFNELESNVTAQELGLNQIVNYANTVGGLDQGIERWVNEITGNAKTLLGDPLNAQEFNQQLASGQVQGLLGALRLEVVGPGVLTEQDAQRILSYLGGDPASALQNPEVVKAAISRVVQDKMANYATSVRQYNRAAPSYSAPLHQEVDFMSRLPKPTVPLGVNPPQAIDGSTNGVGWRFVPSN